MDRRESIKSLLIGAAATSALFTAAGCEADTTPAGKTAAENPFPYEGTRIPEELRRDARLHANAPFFSESERKILDHLADIILPADEQGPAASATGVTDFIDFMTLDFPDFQLPLRGGLAWLSRASLQRFDQNDFMALTEEQQMAIIEDIAYLPEDPAEVPKPEVAFFDLLRRLVTTGYFTSKEGIKDLGYKGNAPNLWDGPPEEVLRKHGITGEEEWLSKCIDHDTRNEMAEWDENGNLLT
jgi:hypothetical protein